MSRNYPWPENVRELGQSIRQILLNRSYQSIHQGVVSGRQEDEKRRELDARGVLQQHCNRLYREFGTYREVARRTRLDRRTVKKYILKWQEDH